MGKMILLKGTSHIIELSEKPELLYDGYHNIVYLKI